MKRLALGGSDLSQRQFSVAVQGLGMSLAWMVALPVIELNSSMNPDYAKRFRVAFGKEAHGQHFWFRPQRTFCLWRFH